MIADSHLEIVMNSFSLSLSSHRYKVCLHLNRVIFEDFKCLGEEKRRRKTEYRDR